MRFLIAALAAGSALATPLSSFKYAVKESHPVPPSWTELGPAPPDAMLKVDIGLKQDKFHELERHLYEVSDPDHHRYGQHLSAEDIDELIQPSQSTTDKVHEWLAACGIQAHELSYSNARDWISVNLPVAHLERMLQTKYSVFMHKDGSYVLRAPSFSLPEHLHEHIDMISPTNSFFRPAKRSSTVRPVSAVGGGDWSDLMNVANMPANPTVSQACNASAVTPLCLRTLYGTLNYKPQVPGKNKVSLNDFLEESNNRSDVKLFLEKYRPDAVSAAYGFQVVIIADGNNQQSQENATELAEGKDLEGNLDAETILGIDYPTPLVAFTTGGSPPYKPDKATTSDTNEPYLTWLNYVLAQKDLPQVVSTSYDDDEQTVPLSYATKTCNMFAQLGARGVSLFFAAGDDGVGPTGACQSNNGSKARMFIPEFPSSCPYVTAVGGLKDFNPEVVAYDPENGYAGGGGFSNYFAAPAYQKAVVDAYVKTIPAKYDGLYNKSGRAYPDISAQGYHFLTAWNGTIVLLDGTSAATPTAAAVIALVNDALIAKGKSPLGFLNPWLYSKGYKAFNDVTSGTAIGCDTEGFAAAAGWDAASGWGSPNFPKITALLGV